MKDKIIILDEHTVNQIAAGEVIEQPSSVVKELVENSMDAGARNISIKIREAGLKEIKVRDDGRGIDEENIEKAFSRYGTSKLSTIDDLYSLSTMGFRGEALASIAAVSKVRISSRTLDSEFGITLQVEGGQFTAKKAEALNIGTSIKVKELFYNTPVRQKFLRSTLRETRDIVDIVEKLALSRPDIKFTLEVDGKIVFNSRGNSNIRELAAMAFSFEIGKEMIDVDVEKDGIRIHGLVGRHTVYRGNRDNIIFFVNSRYVVSDSLSKAFESAYRNRLPINKFPVGIIYLELPSCVVEVNIHPRKLEVKIDREDKITEILSYEVERLLLEDGRKSSVKKDEDSYTYTRQPLQPRKSDVVLESSRIEEQLELPLLEKRDNPFSRMRILGSVSDTYIVAAMEDELYIFDQHAAHERINYEEALREFKTTGFKTQILMEPYVLNLSNVDYMKIIQHIDKLVEHGVMVEAFGEDAFLVRGLPLQIIGEEASKDFLLDLIDSFENRDADKIRDIMLEKAACSRSVKAGWQLNSSELKALVDKLGESEFPFTCPHGRPTFLKLTTSDLEKMFLRSK